MQNNLLLCLILVLFFLQISCDSKPAYTESQFPIISLQEENFLEDAFGLIERGEVIQLSTKNKEGLISFIDFLMFAGDTLIVFDDANQKIVLYNADGDFISDLNMQGKGPGEYSRVNDIIYHNDLYILDGGSGQIHRYNLSGEWRGSKKYNSAETGTSFAKNNHAFIFYRNGNVLKGRGANHNLVSFSTDSLKFIDSASYIVQEIANRGLYTESPFKPYKDDIYALPPFEDVIYRVDAEGKIDSAYMIDVPIGSRVSEEREWKNMDAKSSDFLKAAESFQSIFFFSNLQISNHHIMFGFRKNQEFHYCLYDKNSGKSHVFKSDRLLQQKETSLSLAGVQGDHFYFRVHNHSSDPMEKVANSVLREDVNQVLYKVKFKHMPL
jgi:hypothetical protein